MLYLYIEYCECLLCSVHVVIFTLLYLSCITIFDWVILDVCMK